MIPKDEDVLAIGLSDETSAVAQVLRRTPSPLRSVAIALFDQRHSDGHRLDLRAERALATMFTFPDLIKSRVWKVVGNSEIQIPASLFPFENTREVGFVGASVVGSRNVEKFCKRCFWAPSLGLDGRSALF